MATVMIRFEFRGQVYDFPAELPVKDAFSGSRILEMADRYLKKVFTVPHNTDQAILLRIKVVDGKPDPQKFSDLVKPPPTPKRRERRRTPTAPPPEAPTEAKKTRTRRTTRTRTTRKPEGTTRRRRKR